MIYYFARNADNLILNIRTKRCLSHCKSWNFVDQILGLQKLKGLLKHDWRVKSDSTKKIGMENNKNSKIMNSIFCMEIQNIEYDNMYLNL